MATDRATLCIEMHWDVVIGLAIGTNLNPLTSKIGDLNRHPLYYGQRVTYGTAL